MKKYCMLVLAMVMTLSLCLSGAYAAQKIPATSGSCGETSQWRVDPETKTLYISGTGSATIPSATSIIGSSSSGNNFVQSSYINSLFTSDNWYYNNIKKVVVEEGITEIGYGSFYGCSFIEEIQLPSTLRTIQTYAFCGLTALEELIVPEGVGLLSARAFEYCYHLKQVSLPSTLESMSLAFHLCSGLQVVQYAGTRASWEDKNLDYGFDKDEIFTLVCRGEPIPVGGFADVRESDYFAAPVLWAVENDITTGTSKLTFSPEVTCTRAQILTFLWRSVDSPWSFRDTNPFTDVDKDDYYQNAAIWAHKQGLVTGSILDGDRPGTRAEVVSYLWKLAGAPETQPYSFSDVPADADCAQAVAWAVQEGITSGTGEGKFSPDATCTRAQIVTFLYRVFGT